MGSFRTIALSWVRWMAGAILFGSLVGEAVAAEDRRHDYLVFLDAAAFRRSGAPVGDDLKHNRKFQWDFSRAKEILLFCNGPWCDQSPRAIKGLVKLGYPVNKMYYYRGGMQDWLLLGLSVHMPPPPAAKPAAATVTRQAGAK